MEKKIDDFSMREAMRLANTDAGKALMRMLQQQHGDTLQSVMDSAKAGDMDQAKRSLAAFLEDPNTKALLQKMQEEKHGRNGR